MTQQTDIPPGWEIAILDDLQMRISNGANVKQYDEKVGYPISRIETIWNGKIDTNRVKYIHETEDDFLEKYALKSGDILFSHINSDSHLGKTAIYRGHPDCLVHGINLLLIRLNEELYADFFNYQFQYLRNKGEFVAVAQRAVNQSSINQKKLKQFEFLVPPLNEQRRIVAKLESLFSELEAGTERLRTARAQLKTYRQAILKHAFEGKLTADWRAQYAATLEPAETLLTRIQQEREAHYQQQLKDWHAAMQRWEASGKDGKKPSKPKKPEPAKLSDLEKTKTLPKLPFGWAYIDISSLCDVVRGGSPRPAGDLRYYEGNIPFLKVADITRNPGAYLNSYTYTIKEAGLVKTRLVKPKTLMLSNSGATLGVPKICNIETTFNDGIAAFLGLKESSLLYHYYFWLSKTEQLRAINQGAAQPNLNTDLIREFPIPLCSEQEMKIVSQAIEQQFSLIEDLERTIDTELQKAESLRQSILKSAFAGTLVPQDSTDEPASALLERIRSQKAAEKPRKPSKKRVA